MDVTFQEMERKLLRIIINPSMAAAWLLGLALIAANGVNRGWDFLAQPWMVTKLVLVFALSGWHGFLSGARRKFEAGTNVRTERFWRMTNEIPFVMAVVIVLAVTTEFLSR